MIRDRLGYQTGADKTYESYRPSDGPQSKKRYGRAGRAVTMRAPPHDSGDYKRIR